MCFKGADGPYEGKAGSVSVLAYGAKPTNNKKTHHSELSEITLQHLETPSHPGLLESFLFPCG